VSKIKVRMCRPILIWQCKSSIVWLRKCWESTLQGLLHMPKYFVVKRAEISRSAFIKFTSPWLFVMILCSMDHHVQEEADKSSWNGDPDRNPKAILVLYFRLPVPICMRNSKIHQIIFSRWIYILVEKKYRRFCKCNYIWITYHLQMQLYMNYLPSVFAIY
jgi:hypothetical protein